jgi:predicted nucleotidyltransferase component of viral defense system
MIAIYQDEFLSQRLVMRGGTALNKLYLHPQPRYSEDIDILYRLETAVGLFNLVRIKIYSK